MMRDKPAKIIINYRDFLKLSANLKKDLFENEFIETLISIKKDEYKELSAEEKEKLRGFRRTEMEPLKKQIVDKVKLFKIKDVPEVVIEESFKEKHKKQSKPYCPKNIYNKNFNTKKKGGR